MHKLIVPGRAAAADANEGTAASRSVAVDSTGSPVAVDVATIRRTVVNSAAYIVALRLVLQLFSWVVTIVAARLLRPYDYGILGAAAIFTSLADVLAEAGVGRALVQKTELRDDDLAGAFTFSLMMSLAMYVLVFGCAGVGARALRTPELVDVLPVVGLTLLLIPFRSVPMAILERRLQLKRAATIGLASSIIQGCVVLTLVLTGFGYWALILGYMVPRFLEVPVYARQASWLPRLRWPGRWSNPIVSYGIHYTGARLCWYAYRNADYAIVGRLLGPIALGYYSFAFMLISIPVEKIVAACNQATFPIFCRISHDPERVRAWYLRLAILLGLLATPALVGLALMAQDAILVVLGAKWLPTVLPLQIMSSAGVVMVLGSSIDVLYNAVGRPDINFRFTALSVMIYPPLFYLCGRSWGLTGVALVWAICYPVMVLTLIGTTRSITGVSVGDVISSQMPLWASALFMALVVIATGYVLRDLRVVPVRLGISIVAGVLSYAAAIRLLAWNSVMGNVRLMWRELRSTEVVHDGP